MFNQDSLRGAVSAPFNTTSVFTDATGAAVSVSARFDVSDGRCMEDEARFVERVIKNIQKSCDATLTSSTEPCANMVQTYPVSVEDCGGGEITLKNNGTDNGFTECFKHLLNELVEPKKQSSWAEVVGLLVAALVVVAIMYAMYHHRKSIRAYCQGKSVDESSSAALVLNSASVDYGSVPEESNTLKL